MDLFKAKIQYARHLVRTNQLAREVADQNIRCWEKELHGAPLSLPTKMVLEHCGHNELAMWFGIAETQRKWQQRVKLEALNGTWTNLIPQVDLNREELVLHKFEVGKDYQFRLPIAEENETWSVMDVGRYMSIMYLGELMP